MHVDHWICLEYERENRSLYTPVRRAVQQLFVLILILVSGNFPLHILVNEKGKHVVVLSSDSKGLA